MPLLVLIICAVITLVLYVIIRKMKEPIPFVLAGNVNAPVKINRDFMASAPIFLDKELLFSRKKTFIGKIGGSSMSARGLNYGDIIIGRKIDAKIDKLTAGDLIIIRISDPSKPTYGQVKIREYQYDVDDLYIQSIKYDDMGNPIPSSPHKKEDIVAIIDRYVKAKPSLISSILL
jgi:hypothetical protein